MGDFPRPFSGNKTKKQDATAKAGAQAKLMNFAAEVELMRKAMPKTRVFDVDDNVGTIQAAKEQAQQDTQRARWTSERTKEMGGPKMISTGIAGVDPMTGMPQANQIAPSAINPTALGSLQPQIPSIAGQAVPGSYNNVMPQPAQPGMAVPLNKYKK